MEFKKGRKQINMYNTTDPIYSTLLKQFSRGFRKSFNINDSLMGLHNLKEILK